MSKLNKTYILNNHNNDDDYRHSLLVLKIKKYWQNNMFLFTKTIFVLKQILGSRKMRMYK